MGGVYLYYAISGSGVGGGGGGRERGKAPGGAGEFSSRITTAFKYTTLGGRKIIFFVKRANPVRKL